MAIEIFTLADLRERWPAENAPRLAVLGDPVAHSLSPGMHNAALAACGIPAVRYGRLHVRADELAETLRRLPAREFLGVNLTIPHKTAALGLLDALDESARRLGAVNTVRVEPGGRRLRGFNTDGPGFVRAVREEFGAEVRDLRVLILGAGGGAGRALAAQCALEGCAELALVNRTPEKAARLAEELRREFGGRLLVEAVPWEPAALAGAVARADLAVNASALGLRPDDPPALPAEWLRAGLLVFDTVYAGAGVVEATALGRAARAAGARVAGGLSLLLHQGALAFEVWFDRPAPVEIMRAALGS